MFVFKAGGLMQFGRWSAITHWRPWLIICDCRHLDLEQGLSKIQLSRSPSSVGFRAFFGSEASQHAPNRDVWRRLSRVWWNIRALFSRTCGCFTLPAFRVLIYRLHSAAKIPSSPWNLNDLHYFWSDLTIQIPSELKKIYFLYIWRKHTRSYVFWFVNEILRTN